MHCSGLTFRLVDILRAWCGRCDKDVFLPPNADLINLLALGQNSISPMPLFVFALRICLYLYLHYVDRDKCWSRGHGAGCDGVVTVLADVTLTLRLH